MLKRRLTCYSGWAASNGRGKRQQLARAMPRLRKILMECKTMQDEKEAEEFDNDLKADGRSKRGFRVRSQRFWPYFT